VHIQCFKFTCVWWKKNDRSTECWNDAVPLVTECDDSGHDDDGNVIAEASNGNAADTTTNGTGSGRHKREVIKKV